MFFRNLLFSSGNCCTREFPDAAMVDRALLDSLSEVAMLEETDRQVDNARTRVTRHRLVPGAHTGFHRHEYDYVVVPITDGRMRIVEGGQESLADLTGGAAYVRQAGVEHDVFNGGDRELIFVEVELMS
jgi:mannose-6-phosphate isomerase-like protein (cupin superfamily)